MRLRALRLCVLVCAFVFAPLRIGSSQIPPATQDSTPRDTARMMSGHGGIALALAIVTAIVLVAPGPFVPLSNPDTTHLGFARNHLAVSATGGLLTGETEGGDDFNGLAYSASVEVFRNGVYGEVRGESYDQGSRTQFWTIRAGYLMRPKSAIAGGATIGYRFVTEGVSENALEVGFPLAVGSPRKWIRLEPTYVISTRGVSWNYRFQTDFLVTRSLSSGLNVDVKPSRQHGPYFAAITLLLGWRR